MQYTVCYITKRAKGEWEAMLSRQAVAHFIDHKALSMTLA